MRRWISARSVRFIRRPESRHVRGFHADAERVEIKCGSAGNVSVDLHDVSRVLSSHPLLVYLPSFYTAQAEGLPHVPDWARRYPMVSINYRWADLESYSRSGSPTLPTPDGAAAEHEDSGPKPPFIWPRPIHDTLQAYSWIVDNLSPSTSTRRDVYVYGSYLGASLACSLALTETHSHQRMAVRGCVAFNGIYNWTMFLSDHPIHKQPKKGRSGNVLEAMLSDQKDNLATTSGTDESLWDLEDLSRDLFPRPDDMFDPFASPCLFFHTPGLFVPKEFDVVPSHLPLSTIPEPPAADAMDALNSSVTVSVDKPPRKSPLAFPPRASTLKIPEMLLLHTSRTLPPDDDHPPGRKITKRKKAAAASVNDFRNQAQQLGGLCRRSLAKLEFKERMQWDEDFVYALEEGERRVQICDAGEPVMGTQSPFPDVPEQGMVKMEEWLDERMLRA